MSHKSIGHQIKSISFLLIGGLISLSLVAIASTLLMRSVFVEYRATARATLDANLIFEDLFEARMAALKWKITPAEEFATEFMGNVAEIHELGDEIAQNPSVPAFSAALSILRTELDEYQGHFEQALESQGQYDEFAQGLSEIGPEIRGFLTDIMETAYSDRDVLAAFYAGRTQESLLLGRFYVERFRKTEMSEHLEYAMTHLNASVQSLATLIPELQNPTRLDLANRAQSGIQNYIEKAELLAQSIATRSSARAAMDTLGPIMVTRVETALDEIVARQDTLGPRGQSFAFWTVALITLVSIAIVVVGWIVSGKNTKIIVDSIEDSVDVMSRIAEGDLDAKVLHTDRENEIGRMARALEVFKSNGKASIEADLRAKAMDKERQDSEAEQKRLQEVQEADARAMAEAARNEMIASLSASLGAVVAAASQGDFSKRVEAKFTDSELTNLAEAVNTLVDNVDNGLSQTGKMMGRIAGGDLSERMEGNFRGAFADLQNNTNQMIDALRSLIDGITGSGVTLASSSAELRDTSDSLSRQAEQNAAALEETSAALEEMSASIQQVSKSVSGANTNAQLASETAQSSGKVAADAASAMERISNATGEIVQVVGVINDISFQINLLALNAGVEAARAGDAGRGFAVVASEVRQLAQRASEAAKEIDTVIARSEDAVSEGVSKVADAQSSLATISDSVVGISERIGEVSRAISEQALGIGEITTSVAQIDENTQKQAASFEEVTAASSILANEAEALRHSTAQFSTKNAVSQKQHSTENTSSKKISLRADKIASAG